MIHIHVHSMSVSVCVCLYMYVWDLILCSNFVDFALSLLGEQDSSLERSPDPNDGSYDDPADDKPADSPSKLASPSPRKEEGGKGNHSNPVITPSMNSLVCV